MPIADFYYFCQLLVNGHTPVTARLYTFRRITGLHGTRVAPFLIRAFGHMKQGRTLCYIRVNKGKNVVREVELDELAAAWQDTAFLLTMPDRPFSLDGNRGSGPVFSTLAARYAMDPAYDPEGYDMPFGIYLTLCNTYASICARRADLLAVHEDLSALPHIATTRHGDYYIQNPPQPRDISELRELLHTLRAIIYRPHVQVVDRYTGQTTTAEPLEERDDFPHLTHYAALYYTAGLLSQIAREYPTIYKSESSENSESSDNSDPSATNATLVRLLTAGDVTKHEAVLEVPVRTALDEIAAKIHEARQTEKQMQRARRKRR